jgi:6-pyruvoyltetrahydropterin/6-carboxytetrahydropterin synthase
MMRTCTRRLEFDAAHRVMNHESKCANLHGHRYAAEVTCRAEGLDSLGRVIDFSAVKMLVGRWIDEHWDHGTIVHQADLGLIALCERERWRLYRTTKNPTSENVAEELFRVASSLLAPSGIAVQQVCVYETPNCWAAYP